MTGAPLIRSPLLLNDLIRSGRFNGKGSRTPSVNVTQANCQSCPVRQLGICNCLSDDELEELGSSAVLVQYPDRSVLFSEDSNHDFLQIVIGGVVRLGKLLPDGRRSVLGFALPGDFLGLLSNEKFSRAAEAIGAVTVCTFSKTAFAQILDQRPKLLRRLHSEMAGELCLAYNQMVMLGHFSARKKTAAFVLQMRDRWRIVNGQESDIPLPMTRDDIGSFLGLTFETVSRMFTTMAREKIIRINPDSISILDQSRIEAIASS